MEKYELAFIVAADLEESKREKIVETIKKLLESVKAVPGELETWGKRDFTFTINKQNAGVYYLLYFQAEPKALEAIERKLKIDNTIIRFLLVRQRKAKIKKLGNRAPRRQTIQTEDY